MVLSITPLTAWSTCSHISEKGVARAFAAIAALALLGALDIAQHLAHGEGFGGTGEQIAAFGAAPRFHKAALFEACQDQFQELLGNLLTLGDVGDTNGLTGPAGCQIEYSLERVFTFDGVVHRGWRAQSPIYH